MKDFLFFWIAVTLLGSSASLRAEYFSAEEFKGWLENGIRGDFTFPSAQREEALRTEYVFVPGLEHEKIKGDYFVIQKQQLFALGVPDSQVHILQPSSRESELQNAAYQQAEMEKIAKENPSRKIVVVAHSRGARSALIFSMKQPQFVRDRVKAMFLLQGTFGGSPLADLVAGTGHPPDKQLPWLVRAITPLIVHGAKFATLSTRAAMNELTENYSRAVWKPLFTELGDKADLISDKIFYIRSHIDPHLNTVRQQVTGSYLSTYYGPNDALVRWDDQILRGLGNPLITFGTVSHNDLVFQQRSRAPAELRKGLTAAIFGAAGASALPGSQAPLPFAETGLGFLPRCRGLSILGEAK